jgi:hypothetical protein
VIDGGLDAGSGSRRTGSQGGVIDIAAVLRRGGQGGVVGRGADIPVCLAALPGTHGRLLLGSGHIGPRNRHDLFAGWTAYALAGQLLFDL